MSRWLVAYATRHGSTREIAGAIAVVIKEAGLDVDLMPAADVRDVRPYRGVILGSAIYMHRWERSAIQFLKRFEQDLLGRPVWLFSDGPTGGTAAADSQVQATVAAQPSPPGEAAHLALRVRAVGHATFGGRIGPEMTGLFERWLPRGDWRDPHHMDAWARSIVAAARSSAQDAGSAATAPAG